MDDDELKRVADGVAKSLNEAQHVKVQAAEIDRCHARLEIDRIFRLDEASGGLVEVPVPMAERLNVPDGIECRDATIKLHVAEIERLRASLAEAVGV